MNPRYQIEKPLGEGGMGKVYKAFDLEKHRPVALKFLQNPAWVPYLESETKILAKLRHPHLVEVYDFHPEAQPLLSAAVERGPCLAMEWIEGQPLDEASAEIGWTEWPRILGQLGEGLDYLHRRKLLHRDLKPGNLFLRKDGEIKILDFGLAGPARQTQGVGGSAAYLAPEAWRGEFGIASDLYALGVTLFQCWTGTLPYPQGARLGSAPREALDLFRLQPELPEYLGRLLLALLQPDPNQRLSSALTLLRYLELHGQRTASPSGRLSTPPLIGRKEELAQLQTWLGDPTVGLIVLSGPTGVGRSRLIEESKWNYQIGGGHWIELGPGDASEWKEISLSRLGRVGQRASDLWSWSEEIQKAAGGQRAALILRDLTAWPDTVLQELRQALTLTAFPSWTWLLDFNVDAAKSEAANLIRSLRQSYVGNFLELKDLSEAEAKEIFVNAVPAGALSEVQRRAWWQASGGRPLLLIEGLSALLADPDSTEFAPPKSFEESALRQVAALPEDSRKLLALVLANPQPLDFSTLRRLWPEGGEDWEEAMLQLQTEDFLAGRDPLRPEIRLARESLRGVLSQGLGRSVMTEAHRAWLKHWLGQTKPEPQAEEIASQIFNHAAELEDRKLAKDWGPAAARFYETRGEVAQAAAIYRKLLPWAEDFKERYTYQAFLAPLLYRLGRLDEALQSYDLWFVDRPDDETRLQKCKHCFYTGLVLFAAAREVEAKARFEECLALDPEGRHSSHRLYRCRALAFLASLEEKHGAIAAARELLGKSEELARGDSLLSGETEQRLGELEASALNHSAAFLHLQASLGHFQTAGLRQSEAVVRQHLALLLRDYGRLPEASALMDQALGLSRACGQFLQWARYLANRALIDLDSANYGRALSGLEKAEKILSALGTEEDRWLLKLQRAELGLALGDPEPPKLPEHPGFEVDLILLQAEWNYSRKRYSEAEELFLQSLNRVAHPRHRLAAGLGLIRSRARLGRLDLKAAELGSTLAMLDSLPGPRYEAWRLLLPLLGSDAPLAQSGGAIREALASLSRLVLPELKRELRELLALGLTRTGLSRAARALSQAIEKDFHAILSQLPEELQMDYEKNRAPLSLDEDLSSLIGASASAETPPAPAAQTPSPSPSPDLPRLTEQRFRQYSQISRQIAQRNDLSEILERVMDAAIELTGAERGYLLLKNDSVKSKPLPGYEIKTARAFNHRSPDPEDLQISTTAVRQAIQRGSVLLTENALLDSELQQKKSVVQFQLKSILVTPLDLEGEIIGAIYLDHRYHPACFREEDVLFLGAFAAQAALAIQKAGLIAELRAAKVQLEKKVESQAKRIDDLSGELAQVRDQLKYGYEEIVGQSSAMMEVFHLLDHVTDTAIPVWIHGESGTGKELVARSLHVNSSRKAKPFVGENCSAIPDTLLESELFGHKRGAFTHADRDRVGLFERADGGTLFLDEVADMPMGMQVKLLRALQEGEIRPLGAAKPIKVDVRLVTASNQDLAKLVAEGKFREDLFFRINGLTIRLPPLRERREDLPLLIKHLIEKISKGYKLQVSEVTDEALESMMQNPWPGNIRQLEGVIRNALLFAQGRPLTPALLSLGRPALDERPTAGAEASEASEERRLILNALRSARMAKPEAAKELGISLRSLYIKMEKHRIPKSKAVLSKLLGLKPA